MLLNSPPILIRMGNEEWMSFSHIFSRSRLATIETYSITGILEDISTKNVIVMSSVHVFGLYMSHNVIRMYHFSLNVIFLSKVVIAEIYSTISGMCILHKT